MVSAPQTPENQRAICPLNLLCAGSKATGPQQLQRSERQPAPVLSPQDVLNVREQLRLSRPVFAHYLRTNPRTLENWEQGRAKPNAQASLLIRMMAQFPDTVQRLAAV